MFQSNVCLDCGRDFGTILKLRSHKSSNKNCSHSRKRVLETEAPTRIVTITEHPGPHPGDTAEHEQNDPPSSESGESEEVQVDDVVEQQTEIDNYCWSTLQSLKLPKRQVQTVLDMMAKLEEHRQRTCLTTSITSIEKFDAYSVRTVTNMKEFLITPKFEGKVTVTKDDVPSMGDEVFEAPFYYEDMAHFLKEEFKNEDYQGQFILHAREKRDAEGKK